MSVYEWKCLNVANQNPFLFKFYVEQDGYMLLLTDLTTLWRESLTKSEIFRRASETDCPIDPSQDDEQLTTLFKHLSKALSGLQEGTAKYELRLEPDLAVLPITYDLPTGLQPLKWQFTAEQMPSDNFRQEVMMPLVSKVNVQRQLIDELVSLLQAKDVAVSNLIDKVDFSGIELTTIFPTVASGRSSRHISKKDHLKRTVKGLQAFDAPAFFDNHRSRSNPQISSADALASALGKEKPLNGQCSPDTGSFTADRKSQSSFRPRAQAAWNERTGAGLGDHETSLEGTSKSKTGALPRDMLGRTKSEGHDPLTDGETTEGLRSNEETVSESESPKLTADQPSHNVISVIGEQRGPTEQNARRKPSSSITQPRTKRLGIIGGSKAQPSVVEDTVDRPTYKGDTTQGVGDPLITRSHLRVRPTLGAIGGRKKKMELAGALNTLADAEAEAPIAGSTPAKSSYAVPPEDPTEINEALIGEKEAEEDVERKANNKREILKRDLDFKSELKTKKRRKF